jgi:hypothetical protein
MLPLESSHGIGKLDSRRIESVQRRLELRSGPEDSSLLGIVCCASVRHRSSGVHFFAAGAFGFAGVGFGSAAGAFAALSEAPLAAGPGAAAGSIASTMLARSLAAFTSEDASSEESETRTAGRPANRTTRADWSTEKRAAPS